MSRRRAPHSPINERGKWVSAVDWRGNRFAVGDEVLYCVADGYSYCTAVGRVIEIAVKTIQRRRDVETTADDPEGHHRPWFDPDRYYRTEHFPVDDVRVLVQTLQTASHGDKGPRAKPGWVNPWNITALNPVGSP